MSLARVVLLSSLVACTFSTEGPLEEASREATDEAAGTGAATPARSHVVETGMAPTTETPPTETPTETPPTETPTEAPPDAAAPDAPVPVPDPGPLCVNDWDCPDAERCTAPELCITLPGCNLWIGCTCHGYCEPGKKSYTCEDRCGGWSADGTCGCYPGCGWDGTCCLDVAEWCHP
jgi:hypothetical protein